MPKKEAREEVSNDPEDIELGEFTAWLMAVQEPIEPEFAKVLCDSLWELYSRD